MIPSKLAQKFSEHRLLEHWDADVKIMGKIDTAAKERKISED